MESTDLDRVDCILPSALVSGPTYLGIEGIHLVVEDTDVFAAVFFLLDHLVLQTREEKSVVSLRQRIGFVSEVDVGDDFQDLLLLRPQTLVDIFLISELNKRDPDTVLVVLKDLVHRLLLQVLIGEVLVVPVLGQGERHSDEVLLLVNVEDPLEVQGDVDAESLLDVCRGGDQELVVAHRRNNQPAVGLVRPEVKYFHPKRSKYFFSLQTCPDS